MDDKASEASEAPEASEDKFDVKEIDAEDAENEINAEASGDEINAKASKDGINAEASEDEIDVKETTPGSSLRAGRGGSWAIRPSSSRTYFCQGFTSHLTIPIAPKGCPWGSNFPRYL